MRCASAVALFLSSFGVAQAPLGSPAAIRLDVAGADPAPDSPGATRLEVGERAMAAGRAADALGDFLAALELHPASPAILRAMLRASAADNDADADARAVFGAWLALATLDDKGRPQPDRDDKDLLLQKDTAPARIAAAQSAAFDELARELGKLEANGRNALGNGLVARWLADLALELGRDMPHVLAARAAEIDGSLARHAADHATVFAALQRTFDLRAGPTSTGTPAADVRRQAIEKSMRATRIALGLAAQVGFGKDLYGPEPPDLGTLPRDAREAIDGLRREVGELAGEPWTVEKLRALSPVEREEFTAAHSTWANPGIAISPKGRYRIETVCGFQTLLGAAETVEKHHARLVAWYGVDPFLERPGLVRIEPEHVGLESNGAPFWWAGGFQGGDVTTLRFAWGSIPGLGRGLTHELTHRFDGTLIPFQSAWSVEGRAVWTGASYGRIGDPSFAEDHLSPWSIQTPFVKGYGGVDKLTKLLDGTIEDYRDNYSAGYALFVYLRGWLGPDGKPMFASRLDKFFKNARGGRTEPVAYFTDHFADGKEGRPEGLPAFADGFREFMHQCYRWCWNERDAANAWIGRYRLGLPGDEGYGMVTDAPSLGWSRGRAEPWFGQGHAGEAARLFEELGDVRAAAAAACWSLLVDGPDVERFDRAARMLDLAQRKDAAWVARLEGALRFASLPLPADAPPITARLSKTRKLLDVLRDVAAEQRTAERPLAAATFAERRDRLALRLGLGVYADDAPAASPSRLPRLEPPHVLGAFGWVEDGLTGYEERRVPNLWFETAYGDVHVGREKPRDDTGLTDRAAHQRHAFTRSAEWLAPGRYVVRMRVHFTTSFVSGAVVVGYTRRDRNLRVNFSAGDFLYSIGRKEEDGKTKAVNLSLDGTFEREGHLPRSMQADKVEFDNPSSFLDLELHVDGPTLDVYAMGKLKLRHTTTDLAPIEGAIGFAMGQGAVRMQTPTVQRLDRGALTPPSQPAATFGDLLHRPLHGVPLSPVGTLVLWVPRSDDPVWLGDHVAHWLRTLSKAMRDALTYPQPWVLMVPPKLPAETLTKIQSVARETYGKELLVVVDPRSDAPEDDVHVLFVDARGALRAAGSGGEMALPGEVATWARLSRPPRRE